tara:strand:+ start:357 stop:1103 length:747 start_codon:yes stop_codon:yes gene_type:complete
MKKACLMITGQMRTYEKCFNNILENIILANNNYEFHIYILTEYYGQNGGTSKNKFTIQSDNIVDFQNNIKKIYGKYLKNLTIESDSNKIDYPSYLNNYGPWIALYKNKILYDSIVDLNEYDIFIRIRPDIKLSNKINLQLLSDNDKTIHILCGIQTRTNSWLHNRDWDHMCISEKQGMKIWCEYYNFLKYEPPYTFTNEIRFNNNGFWCKNENKDKSVIATQLFFQYITDNRFKLNFDALNTFTNPIR